jgi:hypothetical protein
MRSSLRASNYIHARARQGRLSQSAPRVTSGAEGRLTGVETASRRRRVVGKTRDARGDALHGREGVRSAPQLTEEDPAAVLR